MRVSLSGVDHKVEEPDLTSGRLLELHKSCRIEHPIAGISWFIEDRTTGGRRVSVIWLASY
jgi:hypothetical protein